MTALQSAVARATMTFEGENLYPDVTAKAAALMHSLVANHPFVDGKKRVGSHAAILFLLVNGMEPAFPPAELTTITLAVARGDVRAEALAIWLRQKLARAPGPADGAMIRAGRTSRPRSARCKNPPDLKRPPAAGSSPRLRPLPP